MALEKFHYTSKSKKIIVIPKFKNIPSGIIRRNRDKSDLDQVFEAIEAITDDKTLAIIDALDAEELGQFVKAWQEDSKVTVGESTAS
jgi:hypothetical protein